MLFFTGDIHGDIERFKQSAANALQKEDCLIVCGDFGFIWDGSPQEQKQLKWIGARRYHTLFVGGCHDNYDLLAQYPQVDLFGGKARQISKNLYMLENGYVYTIGGEKLFAMGGAESSETPEAELREGINWWPAELPDVSVLDAARARLEAAGLEVDYVVTHDCPYSLRGSVDSRATVINHLTAFFDEVQRKVKYKRWLFGFYHKDKAIAPYYQCLYKTILPGNPAVKKRGLFG